MAKYRYMPLPIASGPKYIRLVTIVPGSDNDDVIVNLQIEKFTTESPPQYQALSYAWGSRKSSKIIFVGSSDKNTLRITKNLRAALKTLRYPDKERIMWIDALCINQSDNVEKGQQVDLMGRIFEYASEVVVWLGPEENGSSLAMERLAYIGAQIEVNWGGLHHISPCGVGRRADHNIADPKVALPMDTTQYLAVLRLLYRTWFDRLWIRQEIFVAEDRAVICCGPFEMPWLTFRKALRLFYSKSPIPGSAHQLLGNRLLTIGGFVFQPRWVGVPEMRHLFQHALCSDPRDRIYGIRALLSPDQRELCGPSDYRKSTVEVYSELARNYISKYPYGLTILRNCELSPHWSGPSWVPNWSMKCGIQWSYDSFASSQIKGWFEFLQPGILRVLAVPVARVHDIRPIPKFYTHDWELAARFIRSIADASCQNIPYPSGGYLLRALARTLVHGAISEFMHVQGGNYPSTQLAESIITRVLSGKPFTQDDQIMGSDAQKFYKRMDWGAGGKTYIRSACGYVGVAPSSVRVDDEIYVIVGCQQPMVLRRRPECKDQYSVVGECYVEGCARGEPLLGKFPDDIGISIVQSPDGTRWSRRLRDLRSGQFVSEDPRLESQGFDLRGFRVQLNKNLEATLETTREMLQKHVKKLNMLELI